MKGGKGWGVGELRAWGEKRRREGKFAGVSSLLFLSRGGRGEEEETATTRY